VYKTDNIIYCDAMTGEIIPEEQFKSMQKDDNRKKRRQGLKAKLNKRVLTIKKERRPFNMVFEDDVKVFNLSAIEEGIYCKLRSYILLDGSGEARIKTSDGIIIDSNNKLIKYCRVGRTVGTNAINNLVDLGLIHINKIGNTSFYYINPLYCRYGNDITYELRDIFDLPDNIFV